MPDRAQPEAETSFDTWTSGSTEGDIAVLAYQLWNDRGCPIGSPDADWFQTETELNSHQRGSTATA